MEGGGEGRHYADGTSQHMEYDRQVLFGGLEHAKSTMAGRRRNLQEEEKERTRRRRETTRRRSRRRTGNIDRYRTPEEVRKGIIINQKEGGKELSGHKGMEKRIYPRQK